MQAGSSQSVGYLLQQAYSVVNNQGGVWLKLWPRNAVRETSPGCRKPEWRRWYLTSN